MTNVKCTKCGKVKEIALVSKKGKPYCEDCAPAIQALIDRMKEKRQVGKAPVGELAQVVSTLHQTKYGLTDPSKQTDEQLLEALRDGNEEEFDSLVRQGNARDRLKELYEERNAIRDHYYAQKKALRERKRELGEIDYYDQLNALKQAYGEQCDRIFDSIRSCKIMIEATQETFDTHAYMEDPDYVPAGEIE